MFIFQDAIERLVQPRPVVGLVDCLAGHVVARTDCHHQDLLKELRETLHSRFGIGHMTIQVEESGFKEESVCS